MIAVVENLNQDWGVDLGKPLGADALLAADLEFASVGIIPLCIALEQCYGQRFGFQYLPMKDGSCVGDLSLSQFATFVDAKLEKECMKKPD